MKTTYTNEQLQEAIDVAFRESSGDDGFWLGIARAFLDNLPEQTEQGVLSLSQLRPLSEAGEVPEGCVRVTAFYVDKEWIVDSKGVHPGDTHFADIRLPVPAEKPEPEIFESHGKTWTRHTLGDPMPCDGGRMIYVLTSNAGESPGPYKAFTYAWTVDESRWWGETIGWRYADEPLVTSPEWTPQAGDVVRLKSGGPLMTVDFIEFDAENNETLVNCLWVKPNGDPAGLKIPTHMLQPSTKENAR